jgi:hypothetical protein
MSEFNATLLREKFILRDSMPETQADRAPLVALSNRIALPFTEDGGKTGEYFVVRAQNMHSAVRFGAQMAREFYEKGPLMDRFKKPDWDDAWDSVTKGYEKSWNPNRWVAVYHRGRIVYEAAGEKASEEGKGRHPFLDIIEQCDARNPGSYEKALEIAKDAFRQAGRLVDIEHDANVALVMNIAPEEGRCGVIVRGPARTTTFNFTARKRAGREVKVSQCLTVSAAFLEGIQLSFLVGMTSQRVRYELISAASPEARKGNDARNKIGRLNVAISQFESMLDVNYRPDRPNFGGMMDEAEEFARKSIGEEIKQKIARGEADDGKWVV